MKVLELDDLVVYECHIDDTFVDYYKILARVSKLSPVRVDDIKILRENSGTNIMQNNYAITYGENIIMNFSNISINEYKELYPEEFI